MQVTALRNKRTRSASSKRWLLRQLNDPYVLKAQKEGLRSRACFKLTEIDDKYKILKKGLNILDLGSSPGSWSEIACNRTKSQILSKNGTILAVDLIKMQPIPHVDFLCGDFLDTAVQTKIRDHFPNGVDVILSDMAYPSCGIPKVDYLKIMGLLEEVILFSKTILNKNGCFLAKVLRGGTDTDLLNLLKTSFKKTIHIKPKASRQGSKEMYVLSQGYQGS
jgi:23S rRNA (uridine2552-2'-O)-methyltransferase